MKKIYVLWSLAIATLFANVFFACKSDDTLEDFYRRQGFTMQIVKTPDFVVYSDGNVLASTLTTKAETRTDAQVNGNYFKIQDFGGGKSDWMKENYPALYDAFDNAPAKTDRDEQVSTDEYNYVIKYIKDNPDKGSTECTIKDNYFIQNVGSSKDAYHEPFMNGDNVHHYADITGGNQMDYLQFGETHINDYNAHWGPRALCIYDQIPLNNPNYHDSWGTQDQTKYDAYKYYYIEYPEGSGTICCYLCFDYRVKKYDNGQLDFKGDGVYNDWVIKISPADGSPIKTPDGPDDPIIDPVDPVVPAISGEVEVNLSVNDKKEKDDYIATKLSIHVRALTDVEVYIPVAKDYYCDVDDMAIVYSHQLDPNYQYSNPGKDATYEGGSFTYIYTVTGEYEKDGETKSANEEIKVKVKYEEGGIRVTTEGISQAALDYLQYTYQDGITFEVWNYFNSEIVNKENPTETIPVTREDLKPMFDQSTVTFTAEPRYYVNAFAMLYDYQKVDLRVYMGDDNKPYLLSVTLDADGKVINEAKTTTLLDSKYWVANEDGTFKEFVGDKNAWDCTVTPPTDYSVWDTHTGKNPADFNVVYKK